MGGGKEHLLLFLKESRVFELNTALRMTEGEVPERRKRVGGGPRAEKITLASCQKKRKYGCESGQNPPPRAKKEGRGRKKKTAGPKGGGSVSNY